MARAYAILLALLAFTLGTTCAFAQTTSLAPPPTVEGRYASIVVEADTLDIVHARQIDELRYPASLTKVMTLFLMFDALDAGEIELSTPMTVSKTAASAAPTKLGLKAGSTIRVEDAMLAIAVKSSNDVAVVVAEHLAGDVESFTARMTARARELGMSSTAFSTPNGLPDPHQVTTARDMAKLAAAVLRIHPDRYEIFGAKTFEWRGRTHRNTNGLLHGSPDVDGFKTGYTRASGYNLIVSAERPDEAGVPRRLIAVVLGGASGASRNSHMADLLDRAFERLGAKPVVREVVETVVDPVPEAPPVVAALSLRRSDGTRRALTRDGARASLDGVGRQAWAIQLGLFPAVVPARDHLTAVMGLDPAMTPGNAVIQPVRGGYQPRFTGLTFDAATSICARLAQLKGGCGLVALGDARG